MKTFLQLTKEECLDVYPEVLENAKILFSSAQILAEHQRYGNAIGLLVLGSEECIKSMLLFLEGYGFDLFRLKAIQEVFSKQGRRSHIVRNSYSVWMLLQHILDYHLPSKGRSTQSVPGDIRLITAGNNFAWWKKADHLKGKGLYTDYVNRLICPSNLSLSDYQNAATKTQNIPLDILRYTDQIKSMNRHALKDLIYEVEASELVALLEQTVKQKPVKKSVSQ